MRKLIPLFIILLAACAVWAAGVPYTGSVDVSDVENLNSATITYDNSTSGMTADDVKDALDELDAAIASVSTAGLNLAGISVTAETTGIDAKYMLMEDSGAAQKMTMENLADWIALIAQPLDAQLTDLADGTITGDFVNTANPWADNEVSDTITVGASGSVNDAAIPAGITRDTEWNTVAKIETATSANIIISTEIDTAAELNTLTTDTDMVLDTDIGSTVQAYHASLAAIAAGTWTGANSITTLGTIATGVWNGTKIDADYIDILSADTTLTDRDDTDYILLHDSSGVTSAKMTVGNFVSGLGGTGSSITLDLADDGNNESTGVTEIATTGTDTNSIFTEPSANKLLINLGADWPKADVADVASTGDSATSFFSTGTVEIGVGGTGSALTDPNADRVMFWDDSEGAVAFLTMDTNHFSYSATTLSIGTDTIDATLIDWGSGANQVDLDDVPDSATYQKVAAGSVNASAAVDLLTDSDATGAITVTGLSTTRTITFADADQTVMSSTAAQNVSGDKEIQDNVALSFGNDNDWEVTYDETTDDRMEWTHAAGAGADVYWDLNDNAAASTFYIANSNGTYAANLNVDGTGTFGGGITITQSYTDAGAVVLYELAGNGTDSFTIQSGDSLAADVTWTVPTAAAGGSNYLVNVDADGTMDYTNPATFQSVDADLTALAALATSGGAAYRTAEATWTLRSVVGTANQITVTNGNGIAGAPTISLPSAITLPGTLDLGDNDMTSLDRLEGIDATEFIDLGADGLVVIDAGTSINLDSTVYAGDGTYSWGHTPAFGIEGVLEVDGSAYFDGYVSLAGSMGVTGPLTAASFTATRTTAAQYIQLYEGTGSGDNYQTFTTPALSANAAYTLPTGLPATDGLILSCTSAGVMSWAADAMAEGAGSGTMTTVKEADAGVGGADIVTLDFGAGFDLAESPDTEIQISLDLTEYTGAAIGSTSGEITNIYMGDSAVLYGQADQSATLTASASTWTASAFAVTGALAANGVVNLGDGGDMIKAFHLADFAADRDYSAIDGCIAYAGTSGISVGTLVSLVSIASSTGINMPVKIASSMGGAAQYCPAQYIVVSIIDGSGNGTTTAWGGKCRVMSIGKIRIPSASYTTGAPLYLSTTGTVTATAPTTSLYNRQIVGYACDTNIADIRLNNVWTTIK